MWRGFFLGVGIYLLILGAECMGVEQVTLKLREPAPAKTYPMEKTVAGPQRKITPPRWAPWSLMSTGAVVCLYSFTIPARVRG